MQGNQAEFLAALERHRAEYRRTLPQRIAEMEARWHEIEPGQGDPADLEELLRAAHSLAGSAGTFGLLEVWRGARALEENLRALMAEPPAARPEQVSAALGSLRRDVLGASR